MPIAVVCSGCQARFNVSDKFAGKKGPCPKCKATITIPALAPAPKDEVKIHVPEEFRSAGKDSKGRPVSKPIARKETKLKPVPVALGVVAALVVVGLAFVLRRVDNKLPAILVGLLAIGPPLAIGGYSFLRDQELEPYNGRPLWIRAAICAVAYALLWGIYALLDSQGYMASEMWQWLFVAPIFVAGGAAAAWALLDLDFGSASLHYSFYLLVTLLLRAAMGLPPLWNQVTTAAGS